MHSQHYAEEALCRPPQMAYGLGKGFLQILAEHQGEQLLESHAVESGAERGRRMQGKSVGPQATRRWWHPLPITPERLPTPALSVPAGGSQPGPQSPSPPSVTLTAGLQPEWFGAPPATSSQALSGDNPASEAQAQAIMRPLRVPQACPDQKTKSEPPCCPICISSLMKVPEVVATACGCVSFHSIQRTVTPSVSSPDTSI